MPYNIFAFTLNAKVKSIGFASVANASITYPTPPEFKFTFVESAA